MARKGPRTKKTATNTDEASVITFSVPVEKGFHFFTGLSEPTGIYAISTIDFLDQLKKVEFAPVPFREERFLKVA